MIKKGFLLPLVAIGVLVLGAGVISGVFIQRYTTVPPPLDPVIYQTISPYGYIRSDLYDAEKQRGDILLDIIDDQDRIIKILRDELNNNGIAVPEIPYDAHWEITNTSIQPDHIKLKAAKP